MADDVKFAVGTTIQPARRVYLDHALRCPLRAEAVEFWRSVGELPQGVPVSPHRSGRHAADFLEECRRVVAGSLCRGEGASVFFFSSFVTAAHTCLDAAGISCSGGARTVLLSVAESSTMRQVVLSWASLNGWQVIEVPCDSAGRCTMAQWSEVFSKLEGHGATVVCCSASSEAGTLQPGEELATAVSQMGGSLVRDVSSVYCWMEPGRDIFSGDFLLGSAARLGASDFGAFAFFEKQPSALVEPEPISLAGAVFSVVKCWAGEVESRVEQLRKTRINLCNELAMRWPGLVVLGMQDEMLRLPHVLGVRFPGVEAEALALVCDLKGVEFSSSPACVAEATKESRFLLALGLTPREARECCTLAVGPQTSWEDAEFAAEIIAAGLRRVQSI